MRAKVGGGLCFPIHYLSFTETEGNSLKSEAATALAWYGRNRF